jgi:Membrane domain of glycerophosphoryl diester phosphodiesterase
MLTSILKQAWTIYRTRFFVIAGVVLVIWIPLELFTSYMDYFVFGPDEIRKSFKLTQFLDNFIGIIATAGVIAIGYTACRGESLSFGAALQTGLYAWFRMWWTRLLSGLVVVLGCILLIIPGIYLLVRLALTEPIAVCEHISGPAAIRRSFELTKGHFWQIVLLGLVFSAMLVFIIVCATVPPLFFPALDHWLVDAATSLLGDLIGAFGTLCVLCAYTAFSKTICTPEPNAALESNATITPDPSEVAEEPPTVS